MKEEDLLFIISTVERNNNRWKSQKLIAICTNCNCPVMSIRPCVFRHTDLRTIMSERHGLCPYNPSELEIVSLDDFGKHNSKW